MIRNNQSSSASQYSFNERDEAAIVFLEKGHESGDIKSTAMLFDIYDQTFSRIGNQKKALALLAQLRETDELAAEVRIQAECFSNRKLDLFKFVTQSCKQVCLYAKNTLESKNIDQGSVAVLNSILKKETCKK